MTIEMDMGLRQPQQIHPRRVNALVIRKETLVRVLLTGMFYLALWRATGMWYGYPAVFGEGSDGGDSLAAMKFLLYLQMPLICLYICLEPHRVWGYLRSIPIPVAGVVISCLGSLLVSIDVSASIRGLAALTLFTLPPLLYRLRYGSAETFRSLGNFVIAAAFLNLAYTVVFPRFAVMGGSYAGMVKGLFYHKNMMGQFCAIGVIVLLSFKRPRLGLTWSTIIRIPTIAVLLLLILLSRSSTAVVMMTAGIGTILAVGVMQRVPGTYVRGGVLVALIFVLGFAVSSLYLGVAESIAEGFGKDLTFSGRTNIWEQLLPVVYERPILGYGYGAFRQPWVMEQYVNLAFEARSVHNTYLGIALDIGVPAMLLWTTFAFSRICLKIVMNQRGSTSLQWQSKEVAIILLVLTSGMMEANMMLAPNVLWPLIVMALPLSSEPSRSVRRVRRRSLRQQDLKIAD